MSNSCQNDEKIREKAEFAFKTQASFNDSRGFPLFDDPIAKKCTPFPPFLSNDSAYAAIWVIG